MIISPDCLFHTITVNTMRIWRYKTFVSNICNKLLKSAAAVQFFFFFGILMSVFFFFFILMKVSLAPVLLEEISPHIYTLFIYLFIYLFIHLFLFVCLFVFWLSSLTENLQIQGNALVHKLSKSHNFP